jgi:hypothetical protein
LPLTPWGTARFGLNLWSSLPGTLLAEGSLFTIGVFLYARATVPLDRIGSAGLWALVGFLIVVALANAFGPPPPSVAAVAWSAEAMWLLVLWGYWVDRHRSHNAAPAAASRR